MCETIVSFEDENVVACDPSENDTIQLIGTSLEAMAIEYGDGKHVVWPEPVTETTGEDPLNTTYCVVFVQLPMVTECVMVN